MIHVWYTSCTMQSIQRRALKLMHQLKPPETCDVSSSECTLCIALVVVTSHRKWYTYYSKNILLICHYRMSCLVTRWSLPLHCNIWFSDQLYMILVRDQFEARTIRTHITPCWRKEIFLQKCLHQILRKQWYGTKMVILDTSCTCQPQMWRYWGWLDVDIASKNQKNQKQQPDCFLSVKRPRPPPLCAKVDANMSLTKGIIVVVVVVSFGFRRSRVPFLAFLCVFSECWWWKLNQTSDAAPTFIFFCLCIINCILMLHSISLSLHVFVG